MFDLKVANSELQDSTCCVSWCVDAETLKYLSDKGSDDPQVVIVVASDGPKYSKFKEYRKVVSLKDLMTYVELRSAGPNKIWAFIVPSTHSQVKDRYLSRTNGQYDSDVLNSSGTQYTYNISPDTYSENKLWVAEPLSVVVPTGVFAAEPAKWEKTWVNHLFRNKPIDQCDFRRRRLFAYTLQPILMMFNILVRFLFIIGALLIGSKGLSLKPLFHPLSMDLGDSFDVLCGGSIFIVDVESPEEADPNPLVITYYLIRTLYRLPLMPAVFLFVGGLVLAHAWTLMAALGIILSLIYVIVMFITFFTSGSHSLFWGWVNHLLDQKDPSPWYLDQQEIDMITCKPNGQALNFDNIPSRKKTLYLRYQNLKSKICKPFST